jgi:hypothetical protein
MLEESEKMLRKAKKRGLKTGDTDFEQKLGKTKWRGRAQVISFSLRS